MPNDRYYKSEEWKLLRAAVIKRAHGKCEVPGCGAHGFIVDHVLSRRNGGSNALGNLRLLCRRCDNRVKEGRDGQRKSGGRLVIGCDANGLPIDPNHPWFKAQS